MDDDSLVPWSRIGIDTVDCQTHKQMALDIARKSLVLVAQRRGASFGQDAWRCRRNGAECGGFRHAVGKL